MSVSSTENRADSDIESSTNFQFPTIPVSGTPLGWLSQSLLVQRQLVHPKMVSQNDADSSCDEATSSLGDGPYEFVDDRSLTTDDEEDDRMTESTSSEGFEADQPANIPAAQHTPSHISTEVIDNNFDDHSSSVETPTCTGIHHDAPRPSKALTEEQNVAENPNEPVEFEEPSVIDVRKPGVEVSCTVRVIEGRDQVASNLQNVLYNLPEGSFNVTVRQAMTTQSIDLKGEPYKLLIMGDASMKDPVIQKIGTVLAAHASSSPPVSKDALPTKYSIIPVTAFEDTEHPDVVLIGSSGLEMSVEECTSADAVAIQDLKYGLKLSLSKGNMAYSSWAGSEYRVEGLTLPDLAIFCTSDDEHSEAKHSRKLAHAFMNRHKIPSLIIQKKATWGKGFVDVATGSWGHTIPLNYLTPHICLERRDASQYNNIARRYPIDLATFLSIDAGQLNRNLACLAMSKRLNELDANQNTKGKSYDVNLWYSNAADIFRKIKHQICTEDYMSHVMLFTFVTTILLLVILDFIFPMTSTKQMSSTALNSTATIVISSTTMTELSLSNTATMIGSPASSASSQLQSSIPSSSNTDIASFLMDAYNIGSNKSDKVMVQVLGDRHIIINAPRWPRKARKVSEPLFRVSRQNQTIEHILSPLGDGVYALKISHEEAVGTVNVSMNSNMKGFAPEELEVDFGPRWLNMAAWKQAIRARSARVQKGLSIGQRDLAIVFNQTKGELSTFVQQTKSRFAERRKADQVQLADLSEWGAQLRDFVLGRDDQHQLQDLLDRFVAGRKQTLQDFKKGTEAISRRSSCYIRQGTDDFSHQMGRFLKTLPHLELKAQGRTGDWLKNAQKKALGTWWNLVGVPKTSRVPFFRHGSVAEDRENSGEQIHECF